MNLGYYYLTDKTHAAQEMWTNPEVCNDWISKSM